MHNYMRKTEKQQVILLQDCSQWLANNIRELWTIVSAVGNDSLVRMPDMLSYFASHLLKLPTVKRDHNAKL